MSKAYVGIDPNLSGFGVAIFTEREITLRFISIAQKAKTEDAVIEWFAAVRAVLDLVRAKCATNDILIAIEDPTGMEQKAWLTASVLNKLIGMLCYSLQTENARIILPSSVTWKSKVCGNARATKEEVMLTTSHKMLGVENPDYFDGNHHISDAVALAMFAESYDMGDVNTDKEGEGEKDGHSN